MAGKGPFYEPGLVSLLVNFAHVGTASLTQYTCVLLLIVRGTKMIVGVSSYITLVLIKIFCKYCPQSVRTSRSHPVPLKAGIISALEVRRQTPKE